MAVSLPTDPLLEEVLKLKSFDRIKVTVKSAARWGATVGITTFVSGVLGGPMGLVAGGIGSSLIAGYWTRNTLQSVPYILLHEATPSEKEKLAALLRGCIQLKHIFTIQELMSALENNEQLVETVVQIVVMFLTSEMGKMITT